MGINYFDSFHSIKAIIANFTQICDLLREEGPTAVERRFKTQLTTFSL